MADPGRKELERRIRALEAENERLRAGLFAPSGGDTVRVPPELKGLFDLAQRTVGDYFNEIRAEPSRGTIEIAGERYVLVRASALSYGFLSAIRTLYADRGDAEALHIGQTLLFDIAHVIGINDARNFHSRMGLTDPVAKLSAGPVHFAYSGWAFVDILPESTPSPDDGFFLTYHHPFSFESDSWVRAGKIACRAKGDDNCTFVMAPPHRLREYVQRALSDQPEEAQRAISAIPTLFERKEVEERLREAVERAEAASAAKSLFLANMSHEIRTPLTGLLGMASLLMREDLGAQQRQYVETLDQSGQALLAILNDILDLSKVEAGMMTISIAPCDVRGVLNDVADVLRARVAEKGLAFTLDVDEDVPPFVATDPLRLRQVVMNLAGNAVKFTDEGAIAVRATWSAPGTLAVEVEDSGIGIAQADIGQLFDVFTQADTSDSRRHRGTGLGLSIARRLVELMGGRIDARSAIGEGSTFWFTVPAEPVEGEAPPPARAKAAPRRFDARILLVEDDKIARFVVEKLLAECGCRIDAVPNGEEAVAAVAAGRYDLVLMDCQMPVMDGYEATRRIREMEAGGRRTPIIAMTASVMRSDSQHCLAAGMDDYLGKPLDPERMQEVLARWLTVRD
jgi:signal transduction histidine kinase/ActR/RegA family two-component response regulator